MHGASKHIIVALLVLCTCIGISIYLLHAEGITEDFTSALSTGTNNVTRHRSYSSDPQLYAIIATSTYKQKYTDTIFGGIVSHHLLANIDISNFFAEFSDQKIDRVVIIGPNHYYPNAFPFLSTTRNYATPFGDINVDAKVVTDLVENKLVEISSEVLEEEHSVSSLVPYVSAYFPSAEIVPIIVSARASKAVLQELSDYLIKQDTENTIVIASVDFSHHLYSNASQIHDARSVVAIESFDYESLLKLELDSPGSLFVLLKYLASKGAYNISIQQQSSANIFKKYDSEDVTTYVFAHARTGDLTSAVGVSALFFGDTMLGRGIAKNSNLFTSIGGQEKNFLKGYDGVVVNLEGAIERDNCTVEDDDLLISPRDLLLLTKNYITHVGIMNNHFGRCPYNAQVKRIFDETNLIPIDDSGATIKGTNIDVGVISFFTSPVPDDITAMTDRVKELSATGKIVVVNMHWGIEYDTEPSIREKKLAHALIDAGANVIIGHHPHVAQPVEVYKKGFIFYSLGNFVSDQINQQTKEGFAVGLLGTNKYLQLTLFPYLQNAGIPTHLSQIDARAFCTEIYKSDLAVQSPLHPCIFRIERQ